MNFDNTIKILKGWSDFCFENEEAFLRRFAKQGWILTSVCWDGYWMRFVYIEREGMHIADQVGIGEWLDFFKNGSKEVD